MGYDLSRCAVVFDLDGTLIDSVPDVHAAINRTLRANQWPELSLAEVRETVGEGARAMWENVFKMIKVDINGLDLKALIDQYLDFYIQFPAENTVIYQGVEQVLADLAKADVPMAICTNKPKITTIPILKAIGLDGYFQAIVCPEDTPFRKPDGRHVVETISGMSMAEGTVPVMIGDSETDIAAAKDAGIASIAVTWGYCHLPIDQLGATLVIDRMTDLPKALEKVSSLSSSLN